MKLKSIIPEPTIQTIICNNDNFVFHPHLLEKLGVLLIQPTFRKGYYSIGDLQDVQIPAELYFDPRFSKTVLYDMSIFNEKLKKCVHHFFALKARPDGTIDMDSASVPTGILKNMISSLHVTEIAEKLRKETEKQTRQFLQMHQS